MITKEQHEIIITLAEAGLNNRLVKVEYEYLTPGRGGRQVILKPIHFVRGVRGGADKLHVVGYDPESEGIRQLAVSNIHRIEVIA
jgi:hypothetical protein